MEESKVLSYYIKKYAHKKENINIKDLLKIFSLEPNKLVPNLITFDELYRFFDLKNFCYSKNLWDNLDDDSYSQKICFISNAKIISAYLTSIEEQYCEQTGKLMEYYTYAAYFYSNDFLHANYALNDGLIVINMNNNGDSKFDIKKLYGVKYSLSIDTDQEGINKVFLTFG